MEHRKKLILYIIVSFVLGAVGGGLVGRNLAPSHDWQQRREGGSPMKEFAERLKLDERQTAMVDSILEKTLYDEYLQQMEEREAKRRSGGSGPDRRSR
jgi:hypothetical protein